MSTETHWKKLTNPDYLGAYALESGKDLIATIKCVTREMITGSDSKKSECTVIHFKESDIKPMVLNNTNAKQIEKIFQTGIIEKWSGKKIQIYQKKVNAFGETVDALRIRPFLPKEESIVCTGCKSNLTATDKMTIEQIKMYATKHFGAILCTSCMKQQKAKQEETEKPVEAETDKTE